MRGISVARAGAGLSVLALLVAATVGPPAAVGAARATGELDPTFGDNGVVVTTFPDLPAGASGIAVQGGHSFVAVGGGLAENAPDFLLARYRGDGTLDPHFGSGGRVVTPLPAATGADGAEAVAIQPDRRIVAVGTAGLGHGDDIGFVVVRYLPDGALDKSFGVNGIAITPVGPAGVAGGSGVVVQPDGKIVVVGGANDDNQNALFAAARYLPNGTLDASFGNGGTVLVLIPGGDAAANAVALQSDGRIVLAGTAIGPGFVGQQFAVVRLTSDGQPDSTFGNNGIVVAQNVFSQGKGGAEDVVIGRDGRILAAGLGETEAGKGAFGLMRFLSDGSLDTTFGAGNGMVVTEFAGGESGARSVLLRPDGRIVAAGAAGFPSTFALAGYLADGGLDTTFGDCGRTTTAIGDNAGISSAVLQPNGRVVVAGTTANSDLTAGSFALARYLGKHDGYGNPPTCPVTGP